MSSEQTGLSTPTTAERRFVNLPAAARFLGISYVVALTLSRTGVLVRDVHGEPTVRVLLIGSRFKVPVADLEQYGDAPPPPPPRISRARVERNDHLIAAYRAGDKPKDLCALNGISRQRLYQLLPQDVIAERREQTEAARRRRDLWERTRRCRVCGAWFVGRRRQKECGPPCRRAWELAKRYFDSAEYERHRHYTGADKPPNRRYARPDSATVAALTAVGRTDVLPLRSESRRRQPPCAATSTNGQPCNRHASVGDDLCHIHRAKSEGRRIGGRPRRRGERDAAKEMS